MANAQPVSVTISGIGQETSSVGLRTTTFSVSVLVFNLEHIVELDDMDFRYLHEQLLESSGGSIEIFLPKVRIWDSSETIELRARGYQRYVSEVFSSPHCVSNPILWVTFGIPVEAAVVQRFLVRGDNIAQLEELSLLSNHLVRLASCQVLSAIIALLSSSSEDFRTVCSGATILSRLSSRVENSRIFVEAKVLRGLVRVMQQSSGTSLSVIARLIPEIVMNFPQVLFAYFQRDSGMADLLDLIDSEPLARAETLASFSEAIWFGLTKSKDVEIALTDKSSVGLALLNKLLVKGRGSETELIVSTILAYLMSRDLVPDYESKVSNILESVVSDSTLDARLDFVRVEFKRVIGLIGIGKPNSSKSTNNELITQLGCYLVIKQAVKLEQRNDEQWFDRNGYTQPLVQKLKQIVFAGAELRESTRIKAAEALLMIGTGFHPRVSDDLRNELEKEQILNAINTKSLIEKIQKLNNFFIEANFDLSSRSVSGPFDEFYAKTFPLLFNAIRDSLKRVDYEQRELNSVHSQALNEVVSGMFEVKSLLKDTESAGKRSETLLNDFADILAQYEAQIDIIKQQKPEEPTSSFLDIREKEVFKPLFHEPTCIQSLLRQINNHVVRMNVDKFAGLSDSVGHIDLMMASSIQNVIQLKTALRKTKDVIEQLLEEIDAETTSSPVTP